MFNIFKKDDIDVEMLIRDGYEVKMFVQVFNVKELDI